MSKSLSIKVGDFTNQQGETKGSYVRLGALMQGNDGGEYLILDPTVSLAGCLARQNMMNHKAGKPVRDSLMVSVFDNSQQQSPNKASNSQQMKVEGPGQAQQQGQAYDQDIPFMSLNPLIRQHII